MWHQVGQRRVLTMEMSDCSFKRFLRAEEGAVAIEYALIAVALTLAIIGGFPGVTAAITNKFQGIANSFASLG
jgi:Flp pilus assembly pilin Flp